MSWDDLPGHPHSFIERAVMSAVCNGVDGRLLELASDYPGFVIEWGFPVGDWERVVSMIRRDYNAWYFDGDQTAALSNWKRTHPDADEGLFHEQVAALTACAAEIRELYGEHIIETVFPGPRHLPRRDIHERIYGRT